MKTLTAVLLTTGLILGGAQSAAGIIVTNPTELAKQVEQLQQMAQQLEQLKASCKRRKICMSRWQRQPTRAICWDVYQHAGK
ncbi:hypothetical protein BANRA_05458 [Klebsiella pneumoniae]|nr:hypothetical protein BANRA_05458 [Klebsiella pneumoniae]